MMLAGLIEIVETISGRDESRFVEAVMGAKEELIEIAKSLAEEIGQASADAGEDDERNEQLDEAVYVVSLINLLVDCCRGTVSENVADRALRSLQEEPLKVPEGVVLQGPTMRLLPEPGHGSTLMPLEDFCTYYADKYGLPSGKADLVWERLMAGQLALPAADIHLSGTNGVVWITDDKSLRMACPGGGDGTVDAVKAYDELALDWSRRWENGARGEPGRARAVLLSVPINRRREAASGIRKPTAHDAWGNLLFVPAEANGTWPAVTSSTRDPLSGDPRLPEAVHGDVAIPPQECTPEACGEVVKQIPDRIRECGAAVLQRAIERLINACRSLEAS